MIAAVVVVVSTTQAQVVQPTSFTPINDLGPGAEYAPSVIETGVDYQENHYPGNVIFNNDAQNNYDVHTSGDPEPDGSFTSIVPIASFGPGGGSISNVNDPFLDGAGENFTVRINGYILLEPGDYTIHLGADDTNLFNMDTLADGLVTAQHNCCPDNHTHAFTITQGGYFPFDNVFGEQGGGDWFDVGISGDGIDGIVPLGDENGPPVSPISFPPTDGDGDGIPDAVELLFEGIDNLDQLGTGDFDGDGLNDPAEVNTHRTDPTDVDSDDDGLLDGAEINTHQTKPLQADSDGDGIDDAEEVVAGDDGHITDPNNSDSDGDGFSDGIEVAEGTDPNNPADEPGVITIQPTSFTPINDLGEGATYAPDMINGPGMDYQENHYPGGVILNNNAGNNYEVHTTNEPEPDRSATFLVPIASFGPGGGEISNINEGFLDGAGENFTVRMNGYVRLEPGTYSVHIGADDTNLFRMDTADGLVTSRHNCCSQNVALQFTINAPGFYPWDNVFGEQGGGDWFDVGISGDGIDGILAFGDEDGPPVYPISFPPTDSDGDGIPDAVEEQHFPGDLTKLGTGDFDGDTLNDPDEVNTHRSDPTESDTDMDGLEDGAEVAAETDPTDPDTDGDGLKDGAEVDLGTDPNKVDTDGDGVGDLVEVNEGTDPNDPASKPSFQTVQPTFPVLGEFPENASFRAGESGMYYQEDSFEGGVIFNNNAQNNFDVVTSGDPEPIESSNSIVEFLDHGGGGNTISGHNLGFDRGGENFTVAVQGYVDFTGFAPGDYTVHIGADDTNLFTMDTLDGQVVAQHNCCPQDHQEPFTLTAVGIFPFINVFGEQGGGDWTDLGISGPGIDATVALGDVAAGSPPVFQFAAVTEPFRIKELIHDAVNNEVTFNFGPTRAGQTFAVERAEVNGAGVFVWIELEDGKPASEDGDLTEFIDGGVPPGSTEVYYRVTEE